MALYLVGGHCRAPSAAQNNLQTVFSGQGSPGFLHPHPYNSDVVGDALLLCWPLAFLRQRTCSLLMVLFGGRAHACSIHSTRFFICWSVGPWPSSSVFSCCPMLVFGLVAHVFRQQHDRSIVLSSSVNSLSLYGKQVLDVNHKITCNLPGWLNE